MRNTKITDNISMNFEELEKLKHTLTDNHYAEYIFHKFFSKPDHVWTDSLVGTATWQYPECWLARYYLYFVLNKNYIQNADILDLGSNFSFYSVWAVLNGARSVDCFEPDSKRHALARELVSIRNLQNQISVEQQDIDQFMSAYQGKSYDVVFLLDVFYYLTNGIDVLHFLKHKVKPKYLFLESSVVNDHSDAGHFELWYASTDSKAFESFSHATEQTHKFALKPSRNLLNNVLTNMGWKVVCYYTYKDFVGHGNSPPRRQGLKNFYVLENP